MPAVEDYLNIVLDNLLQTARSSRLLAQPEPDPAEVDVEIPDAPGGGGSGGHEGHAHASSAGPSFTAKNTRQPSAGGLTPEQVAAINKKVQQQFGVGTAGQWRSAADDAARRKRTGRRSVSDHVHGLAIDFTGDPAKLDKVAAWFKTQPNVKYVLWRTKDHYDHVHVSFHGKGS